ASPTTVSEIDGIADDTGWMAVEEQVALVHRAGRGTSGRARPAEDRDLAEIAELIADDAELPAEAEQRLLRNIGHRSDDPRCVFLVLDDPAAEDRKSTRLNSSHVKISYAVFCLKKKRAQASRK